MALQLEALASEDGWAVVSKDNEYFLVRPPYLLSQRQELMVDEIPRVIEEVGLIADQRPFDSWKQLIEHLERTMVEVATPEALEKAVEASQQLLSKASKEDLERHLEQLEDRLKRGEWRKVWRALTVLMGIDRLIDDGALYAKCRDLMVRCQNIESTQLRSRSRIVKHSIHDNWFRYTEPEALEDFKRALVDRRQILTVGR